MSIGIDFAIELIYTEISNKNTEVFVVKRFKKIGFVVMLLLVVLLLTVSANAATVDSGMCGENVSWTFDDSGCLTISGTGAIEDYENDAEQPWYNYKYPGLNTAIQKLVIEEGITGIGNNAFRYCGQILEVSLPSTLERIGDYAFSGVSQLPEIKFPSSLRIIGNCAFEKCYAFAKIEVPSGVEEIGNGAFSGLGNNLKEITIAGSVRTIGSNAFSSNLYLEKVTLGEGVASIDQMAFYRCESIKEIAIPRTVNYIGPGAFKGCSSLEKISFSSGTYIDQDAFTVGSTSETPTGCDVYIPDMQVWYDMSFVNIKANPLYAHGRLFVNGKLLTELTVPASVETVKPYAFSNCAELKNVTLESGITSIGESAFGGCKDLEKITIPESVASVGNGAFNKCAKLTVYGTPYSAAEAYCIINSVPFVGAASEEIAASGICGDALVWALDKDGVLTIYGSGIMYDYTFSDTPLWASEKENIKAIIIKPGATNIGAYAFEGCVNIESIEIPKTVTSIGRYSFAGCTNLESATIPASVVTIQSSAFTNCTNLTIYGYWKSTAETYAKQKTIPFVLLSDNGVIASGSCGDNLSWSLDEEGRLTVCGAGRMANYTEKNPAPWYSIRDRVKIVWLDSGVMSIGDNAFNACTNLTGLVVPSSLSNIGVNAFWECSGFERVGFLESTSSSEKEWSRVFIESGNEPLTDARMHQFAPYIGYITSSERVYDAEKNEYYLQMTLICEDGKFVARTSSDIKNFDSEPCDFSGAAGVLEKNEPFATGTFAEFTVNYDGEIERLDNRNVEKVSKCVRFNEGVAEEGLYLVNVTKEYNGVLYFINADIEISGNATAYANALANAISLNLYEDGCDYICIDGDEYAGNSLVKLPSRGNTLVDGTGTAVIEVNSDGEIRRVFSFVDGFTLEEEKEDGGQIAYSFGQSVQIGLIEPWFLKANARVYTDENPINIDYSTLVDYGAYFIRKSKLSDKNATQETLSPEDVINDSDTVQYSKSAGTATVDGSYITASYDKGLYTYEMSDSIFVLFYIEDSNGITYAPIRERNLKNLLELRKDDTENFENALERNVYTAMDKLELNIGAYRAQFDEIDKLPSQKAPRLSDYVAENGEFEEEIARSYSFGNSVQIILVEPWGLKFNARVYNVANPTNINYNNVEEYGAIVYYDTEGTVASMTADELRSKADAYVFSSKNGDATIDGSYITALYNKDIYTYQLDSNAYVMFYVKDENGYHYGDVKVRNAYELAKQRSQDTTGDFGEKEKQVYLDMVEMYEAVKAYRDDYFANN